MSPMVADLVARIDRCCERMAVSREAFGRAVAHDCGLVERLINGGTITLRTLERIELHIDFSKLTQADKGKFYEAGEADILRWRRGRR